jgi:DNA-binding transcriptional regulator YiaG
MKAKKEPPAKPLSVEMRLAVLEKHMQDLHNAMAQLQIMRANPHKLPVMPDGTGVKLSEARRKMGWSGESLAKAIGVSKSTLSLWELERLAMPRWRAESILTVFKNSDAAPPFQMPVYPEEV